ncbi:MAG: hypothetical protein KAR47_14025 [Planctomycetes bacterium]|nr:hypothetical protein [Planctomycetota bacterium]
MRSRPVRGMPKAAKYDYKGNLREKEDLHMAAIPTDTELINSEDRQAIARELRFLWIIWSACLATLLLLLVYCLVFGGRISDNVECDYPRKILADIIVVLGLAIVVRVYLLRRGLLDGKMQHFSKGAHRFRPARIPSELRMYGGSILLIMMMPTSVGLMGIVAFVFSGDLWRFYVLLAISAAGLLQHRPSRNEMVKYFCDQRRNSLTIE